MNKSIYPAQGKKFALTEDGKQESRIAVKFQEDYKYFDYTKCAPESWLKKGWIKEVDI